MKKITNCVKCNRQIELNEQTSNGLCWNCYKAYLLDRIEHMDEEIVPKKEPFSFKKLLNKIINNIKEIFQSR